MSVLWINQFFLFIIVFLLYCSLLKKINDLRALKSDVFFTHMNAVMVQRFYHSCINTAKLAHALG